jgi:gliding motility-associated-like protein
MKTISTLKSLVLASGFLCTSIVANAQLIVNPNQTAQALVDRLVGPGVTTSNAVLNCGPNANGMFSGPSNLGIDSGIVLGTGMAATSGGNIGLNGTYTQSVALGGGTMSDADLQTMASFYSGQTSYNSCVLEFDFIPKGDTVMFDYVFASEEYNTFACSSFTDMFALLISGPGITQNGPVAGKRNVALVPGTNTPVMINTINYGNNINNNCTSIDPNGPYTQYFVNNTGTTVAYNGFTTVLTAIASVIPCQTYRLKFGVSNVGDQGYQSAVMLKAGSLTSTNIQTVHTSGDGANTDKLHVVRGCKPAQLQYQRTDCDTFLPFTFHFEIGGDAIPGVHYEPIPAQLNVPGGTSIGNVLVKGLLGPPTGVKMVTIGVKHPDSVLVNAPIIPIIQRDTVYIYDSLWVNMLTPEQAVCPNTAITIEAETAPTLDFEWSPAQYNTGSLTINPNMLSTRDFTITVTQPGAPATCPPNSRTYHALVEQYPIISVSTDTIVCIADSVAIPVSVSPDSVNYIYTWTPANYLRATNIGTNFFSGPPGEHYYSLNVATPQANCSRAQNIKITAVNPEKFTGVLPVSGTEYDYNDDIQFTANGNFQYYSWTPSHLFVDPFIQHNKTKALQNQLYTVIGIDKYGCTDTASVLINVKFPHQPIMPNAFTPNGDGKNDVFEIPGNMYNKIHKFEIYNRWGQMVFSTIDNNRGWNGRIQNDGKECPQGAYMYVVTLELPNREIKTYKGDVTLIR